MVEGLKYRKEIWSGPASIGLLMPVISRRKTNMDHKLNNIFIFDNRKIDSH